MSHSTTTPIDSKLSQISDLTAICEEISQLPLASFKVEDGGPDSQQSQLTVCGNSESTDENMQSIIKAINEGTHITYASFELACRSLLRAADQGGWSERAGLAYQLLKKEENRSQLSPGEAESLRGTAQTIAASCDSLTEFLDTVCAVEAEAARKVAVNDLKHDRGRMDTRSPMGKAATLYQSLGLTVADCRDILSDIMEKAGKEGSKATF